MPKHSLLRLTKSLYNTPLLADKKTFESVLSYLNSRNAGLLDFSDQDTSPKPALEVSNGIGVITIRGPLTYRTTGWEAACGGFSYEMLVEQADEMISEGARTIVLDIDSGGGEAYAAFESTDELRRMCDVSGTKLYSYADGHACSAAYAIACSADEVICNPFSEVGSIGVLIALLNDSQHLKQEGFERVFITDGTEKIPFNKDGSFRDEFIKDLENRVAELGDAFRAHVSKYTGLSEKTIKNTQAKVYSAKAALDLGLVNKIMTRSEFVEYVMKKHKGLSNAR
jgi:ClpP class serine protease